MRFVAALGIVGLLSGVGVDSTYVSDTGVRSEVLLLPAYQHGWPLVFLERDAQIGPTGNIAATSRLPLNDAYVHSFSGGRLLFDACVVLSMSLCIAWLTDAKRFPVTRTFTLRTLFGLITAIAIAASLVSTIGVCQRATHCALYGIALMCVAGVWVTARNQYYRQCHLPSE